MNIQKSEINKILFITLSNIGDAILTLPVLDNLLHEYPKSKITVLTGERPKGLFLNNPNVSEVIVYNKQAALSEKIKLFSELKKERFDKIIDLRNTFFGAFLPADDKTSATVTIPKNLKHMRDRHLYRAQIFGHRQHANTSIYIDPGDEEYIKKIFKENNINEADNIIVIAAGARSQIKRWPKEKFLALASMMIDEFNAKIILVGDEDDIPINKYITDKISFPILNLTAKTSLTQLAFLLKKSKLLVTNDSAILHLASYMNIPVVALFGPTNEEKYGPWSDISVVVKKEVFCRPCEEAQCAYGTLECMQVIEAEEVLRETINILKRNQDSRDTTKRQDYKRILIVRTDRIGDVLLSTPVIKAVRDAYPHAYIAMMTSPYAKEIVEGNPYLDQVIIYDKDERHKSWSKSIEFSNNLRRKSFDLAIILHPTNRVHLVTFFAGIPRRIGYDLKLGFLLSDRIAHTKQFGEKHELEYNLDLLRQLGLKVKDKNLFMPIKLESEEWVAELLKKEGIQPDDKLLAIHPGASCPSKIWPSERFAEVADKLIEKYGFKALVVAGPKDSNLAYNMVKHMQKTAINLAGKTSVSQLASLLRRCHLFISNDSGPVHIASAVGAAVISIFGRNQKGLSPVRWGPVGKRDQILHKEIGCIECLAHNCKKEFACLKAIKEEDVIKAADLILQPKQL